MVNIKKKLKLYLIALNISIVTTSCSQKNSLVSFNREIEPKEKPLEDVISSEKIYEEEVLNTLNIPENEKPNDDIILNDNLDENTTISGNSQTEEDSNLIVKNYIDENINDVKTALENNEERAADKAKDLFILLVDFLFYEGEISGVKSSDISEALYDEILVYFENFHLILEKYFGENYWKNLKDFAFEIGNDAISNVSDGMDIAGKFIGNQIENISDVYIRFRENNN